MATPNDRAVLNMILNPLLPNEPFDPNAEEIDAYANLPNITECRELEKSGITLAENGTLDKAIEKLTNAISACPSNPSPYNNRAQAYRLAGNIEAALNDLNTAIDLSSDSGKAAAQAYTQRALLYLLKEEREKSKADFQKAADLGNSFAKMQLVAMNPYAAMCNKMLSDVMGKLQRGEQ
uniref:TPR_REGION domain-containing protein n=1 Tax=Panagrellus redivivus TaxID=6233 RepID=A0A7E4UWB3_PANRE